MSDTITVPTIPIGDAGTENVLPVTGYSPSSRVMFVMWTMIIHDLLAYIPFNLLLYYLLSGSKNHKKQHEKTIQPGQDPYASTPPLVPTVVHHFFNHLFVQPLGLYFLFPVLIYFGMATTANELPTVTRLVLQFIALVVIADAGDYWSHRLLHNGWLYRTIHQRHHNFKVVSGLAAEYAHPVEDIIENALTIVPALFMGVHVYLLWFWIWFRVVLFIEVHSGYRFKYPFHFLPILSHTDAHAFHHSHNQGNFGVLFSIWDHLCGTDKYFLHHQYLVIPLSLLRTNIQQVSEYSHTYLIGPDHHKYKFRLFCAPHKKLADDNTLWLAIQRIRYMIFVYALKWEIPGCNHSQQTECDEYDHNSQNTYHIMGLFYRPDDNPSAADGKEVVLSENDRKLSEMDLSGEVVHVCYYRLTFFGGRGQIATLNWKLSTWEERKAWPKQWLGGPDIVELTRMYSSLRKVANINGLSYIYDFSRRVCHWQYRKGNNDADLSTEVAMSDDAGPSNCISNFHSESDASLELDDLASVTTTPTSALPNRESLSVRVPRPSRYSLVLPRSSGSGEYGKRARRSTMGGRLRTDSRLSMSDKGRIIQCMMKQDLWNSYKPENIVAFSARPSEQYPDYCFVGWNL